MPKTITAAMLAIGDELLSGRTRDKNIGNLAAFLTVHGIDLKEVRIVADEKAAIVEALNAIRTKYDLVFTSGGIGPTHDDITADAVAAAFDVTIDHHAQAMSLLEEHYASRDIEFTDARKRMARIPQGAELIANPVSVAPGFKISNVHVMAGVPAVFQAMLDQVSKDLPAGIPIHSKSVICPHGEGTIGGPLAQIQKENQDVSIGSYPKFDGERFSTEIIVRGRNWDRLETVCKQVETMLAGIH